MSEEKKYERFDTGDGVYSTELNKMYRDRKPWQPADPRHILAFMPGTVLELNVKAGDKVRQGDQLVLFKAMKMNNKILAPMDGVIKAVHVEIGVSISKNTMMVEME